MDLANAFVSSGRLVNVLFADIILEGCYLSGLNECMS